MFFYRSATLLLALLGLLSSQNIVQAAPTPVNQFTGAGCDKDNLFLTKYQPQIVSLKDDIAKIIDHVLVNEKGKTYKELAAFVDKFGSRFTGSENLENSIDHMLKKLESDGHQNVHGEPVDVPRWVRGNEWAKMVSPRVKPLNILGLGYSVGTNNQTLEAEVIVVKSFNHLEKIADQVKGKFVVYNFDYTSYGAQAMYRGRGASQAAKHGAVGAFVRALGPFSLNTPHTGMQRYAEGVTKIPAVSITIEDAHLFQRLQDAGEKIVIRLYSENKMVEGKFQSRNVVSELTGSANPNDFVVVSGHIDSWDVGQGAMDDGGGAFISWRALSVLKSLNLRPKLTLKSVLWTAEEMGLIGAQQFAAKHKNDSFSVVMESDIGTFEPLGVTFSGKNLTSQCAVYEIMKQFPASFTAKRVVISNEGSDSSLFDEQGIPIGSLDTMNEKYFWFHHTDADTMDVLDSDQLDKNTALWTAFSYAVAMLDTPLPR